VAIECDASTDPASTGSATATDNCGSVTITYSDSVVAGSCPDDYTILRTWTAEDECNNSSSCVQTITVQDTTPPVITCPSDVAIECDASTDPASTGSATATDNCGSVMITHSDSIVAGSCPDDYTILRTWTAEDECNNSSSCIQMITVQDTTPPVITCPSDVAVECDESTDPSNTGYASAVDNCDSSPNITYTDSRNYGVITRTWKAEDNCGNYSTCQQTITINDTTDPIITCPQNVTVECDESIDPSNTGTATATDNCDTNVTITYTDSETPGSCLQEKVITRTWRAEDDNGNFAECQQTITVEDTIPPVITCPGDLTFECDAVGGFGTATATDNCDPSPSVTIINRDSTAGACPEEYVLVLTYQAEDDCGNSSTCQQTITVEDTIPPVITCPGDLTFECDAVGGFGTTTATDNCDPSPSITIINRDSTAGACPEEYVLVLTYQAEDGCGNTSTCQQTIIVEDTTPPVITCPSDVVVECDESTDPANTGTATAIDNCDTSPAITYSDQVNGNIITRTWMAEDNCGNNSSCQQTITIEDTTPPVITYCPDDVMVECDASTDPASTGTATATDNCGAAALVVQRRPTTVAR
jgi:hypothetical protein